MYFFSPLLFPFVLHSDLPSALFTPAEPVAMLDTFEIITTSGVVLWSRTYAPVNPSVINDFIADTFIEEKHSGNVVRSAQSASANPAYKTDHHTLKWTMVKELGVIFVVRPTDRG